MLSLCWFFLFVLRNSFVEGKNECLALKDLFALWKPFFEIDSDVSESMSGALLRCNLRIFDCWNCFCEAYCLSNLVASVTLL